MLRLYIVDLIILLLETHFMTDITQTKQDFSHGQKIIKWIRKHWFLSIVLLILLYLLVNLFQVAFSSPSETQKFMRLVYTGFSEGAILALIALGLVLVYKSTDVINFAHGEFMVLGGFVGYQILVWLEPLFQSWIERPALAVIVALIAVAVTTAIMIALAIILERIVLRPLIGEPVISVIMITIGLSNIIHAIVGLIWGNNPVGLPFEVLPNDLFVESGRFEIPFEGTRRPLFLSHENLLLIVVVVLVTAALLLFFRYSKYGIAMRATADDQQAAMSMGISIRVVFAFAWALAAITAAIAGLMLGETAGGVSAQSFPVTALRAFPVIILGGLDSIVGAIVGGIIIGFVETFTGGYIDPIVGTSLKDIAPYIVLLIVLMIRPYGLFGQEIIERV